MPPGLWVVSITRGEGGRGRDGVRGKRWRWRVREYSEVSKGGEVEREGVRGMRWRVREEVEVEGRLEGVRGWR